MLPARCLRRCLRPPPIPTPPAPRRALGVPGGRGPPPALPLWQRVAVAGAAGAAAGAGWLYLRREKERRGRARRWAELRALGRGRFQLRDAGGRARGDGDFRGRWVLLYFGFTRCPDICPEELEKMSRAVALLEEQPGLPPVQPLFVTLDPQRDDGAAVGRYTREFHPRLLGLTGTPEEVRAAAASFRVYASTGPPDGDGDYVVDHSVFIYLLGPDGLLLDCYGRAKTDAQIARSVQRHMETYEPLPEETQ